MAPNPPTGNPPPPPATHNLVIEISNSTRLCHSPSAFPINPIISGPKSKLSESDAESIADNGASSSRMQKKKNTKTKKGVKRKLCFEEMSKQTGKGNAAAAEGASTRKRKLREFGDETEAENRRLERKRKLYLSLIGDRDYYDHVSPNRAAKANKEVTKTNTEKGEDGVSSKPLECESLEMSMMANNNNAKQSDKAHGGGVTLGLASKEGNVKEKKLNGGSGIAAADGVMALELPSMGPYVKKEELNELRDNNKAANETTKRKDKVGVADGEEHLSLIGKRVRGVKTKHLKNQKRTGKWEGPVFSKPCNFQSLELSRQANNVDAEDERAEQSDKAGGCSITLCLPSKRLSAKRQVNGGYGLAAAAGNDGEKDKVNQLGDENETVNERLKSKDKDKEYLSLIGGGDLCNDMSKNGRAKSKELKKKKKKKKKKNLLGTAFSKLTKYKSLGLSKKCYKANASNENVKQSDKVNDGVIRYGLRSKGSSMKYLEGKGLGYKSEDVNGRLESQEKIEVVHDWKEYFSSIGGGDLWKNTSMIGSKDLKEKWKQLRIAELELFIRRTDLISKTAAAVIDAIKSSLC